jgi:hypothetical protein
MYTYTYTAYTQIYKHIHYNILNIYDITCTHVNQAHEAFVSTSGTPRTHPPTDTTADLLSLSLSQHVENFALLGRGGLSTPGGQVVPPARGGSGVSGSGGSVREGRRGGDVLWEREGGELSRSWGKGGGLLRLVFSSVHVAYASEEGLWGGEHAERMLPHTHAAGSSAESLWAAERAAAAAVPGVLLGMCPQAMRSSILAMLIAVYFFFYMCNDVGGMCVGGCSFCYIHLAPLHYAMYVCLHRRRALGV